MDGFGLSLAPLLPLLLALGGLLDDDRQHVSVRAIGLRDTRRPNILSL
jgi:hypothetical protein